MEESTAPRLAISTSKLNLWYGTFQALFDVDLHIRQGIITSMIGPSGCGKSTFLRSVNRINERLGYVRTAGTIRVLGEDMLRHRYRVLGRMNYSSPYVDLPFRLTVWDNLRVYAGLYGLRRPRARIHELAEELNLGAFLKRGYGSLSAGQKTRVALAKALLNEPDVLLMDEPTASLDPDMADYVRNYLKSYQGRTGATLLLASHNMTEVERICDDVVILREGRRVDQGAPRELIARYGRQTLEDVFIDIARRRHADDEPPPDQQRTASP